MTLADYKHGSREAEAHRLLLRVGLLRFSLISTLFDKEPLGVSIPNTGYTFVPAVKGVEPP